MTDSHHTDLNDFYGGLKRLAGRLREIGLGPLAESLDVAMAGATSGEILTNVAYVLDHARTNGPDMPNDLAGLRDSIFERADAALRAVGQRPPTA